MFGKSKLALVVAEFFGAATLTAVVLAISKSGVGFPYFIAIGLAFAVGVMLLTVGSVKDVSFNPALTVGLWTARKIGTLNAMLAIAAQLLGGVAAWKVYEYLTDAPLRSVANNEFDWRVFTAEAIGTFMLALAVSAAVYYKYEGNRLAATVGSGLFLAVVLASVASNGLVNPAIALGVQSWSVAYVAGPVVGAVLAVNLYAILFAPDGTFQVKSLSAPAATRSVAAKKPVKKVAAKKPTAKKKPAKKTTRKK
jgi:aquaporin Z